MGKKKFYAVAVGKQVGIYDNWPKAESQVKGFPGARFKGFPTKSEAEQWLKEPQYAQKTRQRSPKITTSSFKHDDKRINIYTDGGAINNPGPGGYGVLVMDEGKKWEYSGGYQLTTNNRMELMAAIVALRKLHIRDKPITLHSDSSYLVNGVTKGWALKWRRNGWVKSDKKPAVNPDLWGELLDLIDGLDIQFRWVKGHSGNPYNERCDQLAVASARAGGLPVDSGYR